MRFRALASDYDGTLAHDGHVDAEIRAGIDRLLASGRKFILVTGRELSELLAIFPEVDRCAAVIAENGALLYRPATKEIKILCESPKPQFIAALRDRGVKPLSTGHVIVATWRPNETTVLEVIHEQGLEMQVIFNKEAVMVLPSSVNKATGLSAVLAELEINAAEVVGVGDAENDHAFLCMCGCAAAVANALPSLKERADIVTKGSRGIGVVELIDRMIADDLESVVIKTRPPEPPSPTP